MSLALKNPRPHMAYALEPLQAVRDVLPLTLPGPFAIWGGLSLFPASLWKIQKMSKDILEDVHPS